MLCLTALCLQQPPTSPQQTRAHTHTHTRRIPLSSPFSLECLLVIQPPLLPPRCSETMWMRSRTWGAHRRENRCHMPLAPRSGMCMCVCVCVCSALWQVACRGWKVKPGLTPRRIWNEMGGNKGEGASGWKEMYENRAWVETPCCLVFSVNFTTGCLSGL